MTSAAAEAHGFPRLAGDGVADVGLLLEGTYPYVSGGVSTWVHEIISGFPELTFGICFLGATPETTGDVKYRLPANVVHVEVHHLMASRPPPRPRRRARSIDVERHLGALARLHEAMRAGTAPPPEVVDTLASLDGDDGLSLHDFLHDDRVFAELCAEYDAHQPETSFIDYFWTLRTMHVPLFKLASIARSLPRFRALHAVSTGYAGALGALVHRRTKAPFILTEHGIYTKERTIDLAHAAWIKDEPASGSRSAFGSLRQLWIQFFEALGRMAYAAADPIISLYDGNRARQIADGAATERTRVIPNGIDLQRFAGVRRDDLRDSAARGRPHRPHRPDQGHQDLHPRDARGGGGAARRRGRGSSVPRTKTTATPRNAGRWRPRWAWTAPCAFSAIGRRRRSCPGSASRC